MLKISLRIEEPLKWKGGELIEIYKNRGNPAQCKSHRGVLVSNVVGKTYHSHLRDNIANDYVDAANNS